MKVMKNYVADFVTHSVTVCFANQVEVCTRFVKAVPWICQSYYMCVKANQAEVWPRF